MTTLQSLISAFLNWPVWWFWGNQDLKNRFRRSYMGLSWLYIHQLVFGIGISLIYGKMFGQDVSEFLPYILLSFATWGFISSSIVDGGSSLLVAEGYIKQIPFPMQVYYLRCLVSGFMSFVTIVPIFLLVSFYYGLELGLNSLSVFINVIILLAINFFHIWIMGLLSVYFRDLPHFASSVLQIMFFVTPVIYMVESIRAEGLSYIYLYNPLFYFLELIRIPLLTNSWVPLSYYLVSLGYLFCLIVVAFILDTKLKPMVAHKL